MSSLTQEQQLQLIQNLEIEMMADMYNRYMGKDSRSSCNLVVLVQCQSFPIQSQSQKLKLKPHEYESSAQA